MTTPKVSILTTVYNREKYLADCIESVLASDYQNWELIIVDDQSKDNSVAIARKYAKEDARIHLYVNQTNLGDYHNRNLAASYAKGKYLKFLDADDIIYPHGLGVMVSAMKKYPEADFGTQYNVREYKKPYPFLVNSKEAFAEHFLGNSFYQSGPTGTIFKRDAFQRLGGFSGKRYFGDTEMWIKFSLSSPIIVFQPALIWWRQHEGQEIKHEQTNKEIMIKRILLDINILSKNRSVLSVEDFNTALNKKKQHLARHLLADNLRKGKFFNYIKQFFKYKLSLKDFFNSLKTYQ